MSALQTAVVDAGLAIYAVVNTPQSDVAARMWKYLLQKRNSLHTPFFWRYEVTSVIRIHLFDGLLTPGEAKQALETALALGGVLSGEHGIGLEKQRFLKQAMDPAAISIMKQIKDVLDPNHILNPGKIWEETAA